MRLSFLGLILSAFVVAASPSIALSANVPAGINQGSIWFTKDPIFAGDRVEANVLVTNSSVYRMKGSMELIDGTSTIDRRSFVIESAEYQVIAFPLIVTEGEHSFRARMSLVEFLDGNERVGSATPSFATSTASVRRFAGQDRNKNGILDSSEPQPPFSATSGRAFASTTSDPMNSLKNAIEANAPAPVSSAAVPILGTIEAARIRQATIIAKDRDETLDEVRTGTSSPRTTGIATLKEAAISGEAFRSPLAYAKAFFFLLAAYVLGNPYVFYGVLVLFAFFALRFLIGLFR